MASDIILLEDEIELQGERINVSNNGRNSTVVLDPKHGNIELGGSNTDGDLLVTSKRGKRRIEISAGTNVDQVDRTIYLDGEKPVIEVSKPGANTRNSKIEISPNQIECKKQSGFSFKLQSNQSVFNTQLSVISGSFIVIGDRGDITIIKTARNGNSETVRVHKDLVKAKKDLENAKDEIKQLRRALTDLARKVSRLERRV